LVTHGLRSDVSVAWIADDSIGEAFRVSWVTMALFDVNLCDSRKFTDNAPTELALSGCHRAAAYAVRRNCDPLP
jgi:hypothetical protein